MELLVVGAGAVGSVYGYLASRNPAPKTVKVTYLIKPKHRKGLEEGLKLYPWKGRPPIFTIRESPRRFLA